MAVSSLVHKKTLPGTFRGWIWASLQGSRGCREIQPDENVRNIFSLGGKVNRIRLRCL